MDIYALGMTYWEIWALGQEPYDGMIQWDIYASMKAKRRLKFLTHGEELPDGFEDLIDRYLYFTYTIS